LPKIPIFNKLTGHPVVLAIRFNCPHNFADDVIWAKSVDFDDCAPRGFSPHSHMSAQRL
jgi:hypothetical protein